MKVIFTGGGTGGHVYPNIAIYEAIREKYPESSFLYIGTKKGAESRIIKNIPQPMDFVDVPSKGLPQNLKSFQTLIALFYILLGSIKSYFVLKRFKPDIIIGSGGYVAAPVLFAAYLLKIKVFIHEQNAVPGRLNRFIAKFSARVGVSFSSTANFFPEDKVVVTGYPLRKSIRFNKVTNVKEKYKIPEKNKVIFIFGGSGGSRTINNAVAEIVPMLMAIDDLTVILSTGRGYSSEYKAFDDTLKVFEDIGLSAEMEGRLIVREYFDNIDEIYSITDLIISRAGAGTIKEITTLGIPCILIPKIDLPGDHQILNAREVEKIGGAKIVYETISFKNNRQTIFVPEAILLKTIKETLSDSETLFNMRRNLRQVEKQNSTELILKELEQLLKGSDSTSDSQIKLFYLQPQDSEKSIELLFDSTMVGTSYLCDFFLEGMDEDILVEFKILKAWKQDEKIIIRRIKGDLWVDGAEVGKWVEIKENSKVEVGQIRREFILKSYFEKVATLPMKKSTSRLFKFLSPGIIFSKIGGFFREIFVAGYFGAGVVTDIWAIALTITYFLRRIVAEHALGYGFLPTFSQMFRRTSRKKAWETASGVFNFTLLLSFISTVLLIYFTPSIIVKLFPGVVARGMVTETVKMTQLILPYLFLVTIASVLATYLKVFNRFGVAEASSAFFSVGIIGGILFYYPSVGNYSLAYGVLLGGFLQIVFFLPFIWKIIRNKSLQFTYKPTLNFRGTFSKKYYSQLGPISLDVILFRTSDLVGKVLASGIATGVVAFLHFSFMIFQLPIAIINQIINSRILNEFTEQIALFDKKKAKQLFLDGININFFMMLPVSVLLIFLAEPLVSVLLERGRFTSEAVIGTAHALQFYAAGLIGWGLHALTVKVFSSRIDARTSIILNACMAATNIGLCVFLVKTWLSFGGIALATSISFLLFAGIRLVILKKKLEKDEIVIKYGDFLLSFSKSILATILMVIVLINTKALLGEMEFSSPFVGNSVLLIALSFVGISVYFLTSLLLKNSGLLIFRRNGKKGGEVPVSMLSPFRFLEKVSRDVDAYRDDYFYKINIYLFSSRWEVRNIGIKLIGLFKDASKIEYLVNLLKSKKANGFVRRNALQALKMFGTWNTEINQLMKELLHDSYYEVRSSALDYLTKCLPAREFGEFRELVHSRLKSNMTTLEEKLACLRLIGKVGEKEEILFLEFLFLTSNSLIREELLELLYNYYRRKLLTVDELKENIGKVLITSNNMNPEFKLKSIIKKIYKEIE